MIYEFLNILNQIFDLQVTVQKQKPVCCASANTLMHISLVVYSYASVHLLRFITFVCSFFI